jgi:uncharacterized protein
LRAERKKFLSLFEDRIIVGEILPHGSLSVTHEEISSEDFIEDLDQITFRGHSNISGFHRNTIELTKDLEISRHADCIIGVNASKSCADLHAKLKDWVHSGRWMQFEIKIGTHSFTFEGRGSPKLDLTDTREIVLRRSDYPSPRTAALHCSHSAGDIPRNLIAALQDPEAKGQLIIRSLPHRKENSFIWSLP